LKRINALLSSLKTQREEAKSWTGDAVDGAVFRSLMTTLGDPKDDQPPPPPGNVHGKVEEQPRYSKMMATLVDQVKQEVDKQQSTSRFEVFVTEIDNHKTKVDDLQKELRVKLAELQKQETSKITSGDIHVGFNSSAVSKTSDGSKAAEAELLNPSRPDHGSSNSAAGTATNDVDDNDDDDDMTTSDLAKKFGSIKFGEYSQSFEFISKYPTIVKEKETDGLLLEAFNAQAEGKDEVARQCVHQGLLIQYCRQLGKDGVGLFFKRVTTPGHQARKIFLDDVNTTYARIRSRSKEMAQERKKNEAEGGGVEQIQLHAVDPNTTIHIQVPSADSTDDGEIAARKIFDSFDPDMRKAIESGKLDEINKVLGEMNVEKAEKIVELMSDGGMLSMVEGGVIDCTTEEGKEQVKELERGSQTVQQDIPTKDVVD